MDRQEMQRAFDSAMQRTRVLVPMRQSIFTFAPTRIHYYLVTDLLSPAAVEMRRGDLLVERPAILTPRMLYEQLFEGFEEDQRKYLEAMMEGGGLKGLQYKFSNSTQSVEQLHLKLEEVIESVRQELTARPLMRATLIQGVPEMWSVSLMKYVKDLTDHSFPGNIRELDERGRFPKPDRPGF